MLPLRPFISCRGVRGGIKKRVQNKKFSLEKLRNNMGNSKRDHLMVLFSTKTPKIGIPLRVIVSENDTWQKPVAFFLQAKLRCSPVNDPFLIRNSEEVIDFLKTNHNKCHQAFLLDIKDLYYSISHKDLLLVVEQQGSSCHLSVLFLSYSELC